MKRTILAALVVLVTVSGSTSGCAYRPEKVIQRSVDKSADKKLGRVSTPDLKLRHAQILDRLGENRTEFKFSRFGGGTTDLSKLRKEKERIERELHRRYQAGDQAARLPIFER